MSKTEWGIKRVCPSCGTKYYDFNKNPIICPKCEFEFDPDLLLKSRKGRSIATKTEEPQVSSDAKKEDKTPKEIVETYHQSNKNVFEKLGISFDIFDRTSDDHHHETAQELFLQLEKKGAFVKQESEQYFDTEFNQFLADRYITGDCPKCGASGAF